jgi:hypothetical protein
MTMTSAMEMAHPATRGTFGKRRLSAIAKPITWDPGFSKHDQRSIPKVAYLGDIGRDDGDFRKDVQYDVKPSR